MKLTKGAIVFRAEIQMHPDTTDDVVVIREYEVTTLGKYMAAVTERRRGVGSGRPARFRCLASTGSEAPQYHPTVDAALVALAGRLLLDADRHEREAKLCRAQATLAQTEQAKRALLTNEPAS